MNARQQRAKKSAPALPPNMTRPAPKETWFARRAREPVAEEAWSPSAATEDVRCLVCVLLEAGLPWDAGPVAVAREGLRAGSPYVADATALRLLGDRVEHELAAMGWGLVRGWDGRLLGLARPARRARGETASAGAAAS